MLNAKIDEINEFVLEELASAGFEDNPENRYAFLTGLRDGWLEDEEVENPEGKAEYLFAANLEIFRLHMLMIWNPIKV
jgi:hypothetical protein